jgi:hypothetical protein
MKSGLVSLESIYSYLERLGYYPVEEGVGVLIEDWPVQFIPVAQSVQEEAVMQAEQVASGETHTFMFSAEHLAAELLRSGREKDYARVIALLKSEQMDIKLFRDIVTRHGLAEKWEWFADRFDLEDYD